MTKGEHTYIHTYVRDKLYILVYIPSPPRCARGYQNDWAPREKPDQYGSPPGLINLRCALIGLHRPRGFYVRTVKIDQTGQKHRLI